MTEDLYNLHKKQSYFLYTCNILDKSEILLTLLVNLTQCNKESEWRYIGYNKEANDYVKFWQ